MATVNLIDAFWLEIVGVIVKVGDEDKAIGNAARFFRYAQEKHKTGRFVTEEEFQQQRFSEYLFPVFAKRVDGGIIAVGADKHFGWLRDRMTAASNGGKVSSDAKKLAAQRREAAKRAQLNNQATSPEINELSTSKSQAKPQNHDPYAYTYTFPYANAHPDSVGNSQVGPLGPPTPSAPPLHWLGQLWNEHSGPVLPKIKKTNAHMKNIGLRVKEEPTKEYWIAVIQRMAKSDFLTGKSNTPFVASFSWMISKGKDNTLNHVKVADGNYDNRSKGGQQKGNLDQFAGLEER